MWKIGQRIKVCVKDLATKGHDLQNSLESDDSFPARKLDDYKIQVYRGTEKP